MKTLAMLLVLATTAAHAGDDPQRFLGLVRSGVPEDAVVYSVIMPSANGEKLKGTLLVNHAAKPEWHAILRITQPSRMAGSAVLVTDAGDYGRQGAYIYMPGVRRVRYVEGWSAGPGMLGVALDPAGFEQLVAGAESGESRVRVASASGARQPARP